MIGSSLRLIGAICSFASVTKTQKMRANVLIIVSVMVLFSAAAGAQKLTVEESVMAASKGLTPLQPNQLKWVEGSDNFSVIENNRLVVKTLQGKEIISLTIEDINRDFQGGKLTTWPNIQWMTPTKFFFEQESSFFSFDYKEKAVRLIAKMVGKGANPEFHPATGNLAFTLENNVMLAAKGKAVNISKNFDPNIVSGQSIARNEFGISKGLFWSKDGKRLAYYQKDEHRVGNYPIADYSTLPATNKDIKYPMAGQDSECAKVGVYNVDTGNLTYLEEFVAAGEEHYLTNFAFTPDGSRVTVAVVNREQNKMWFNIYNADTGFLDATLFTEENPRYVEPEHPAIFIPGTAGDFLWFSERDGFNHLYRYNIKGKLVGQVTTGKFPVTEFLGMDESGKYCYVQATGDNATERHLYRVSISDRSMQRITQKPGTHTGTLSPSGKLIMSHYSATNVPGETTIITDSGKLAMKIAVAANPLEGRVIGRTELFQITPDNSPALWCRVIKPSDFSEKKKYPVLVYVYNGPHVQLVTDSWMGGAPLWMHAMSEMGYVIFTLDGRGSMNRGFEFESAVHRQMGTVELDDQLVGVDWLKKQSWVDASRMAVHGWSYGGFMTTSLMLKRPGTFKVGVAGGPVIDWKYYEVMYTERYMDTPKSNPEGFSQAALTNHVDKLQGKLLMIHGSADDVVLLQHNMVFLKECIDKKKQVDFFVYPGHAHNVRGIDRAHLMEKVIGYVSENL